MNRREFLQFCVVTGTTLVLTGCGLDQPPTAPAPDDAPELQSYRYTEAETKRYLDTIRTRKLTNEEEEYLQAHISMKLTFLDNRRTEYNEAFKIYSDMETGGGYVPDLQDPFSDSEVLGKVADEAIFRVSYSPPGEDSFTATFAIVKRTSAESNNPEDSYELYMIAGSFPIHFEYFNTENPDEDWLTGWKPISNPSTSTLNALTIAEEFTQ